MKRILVVDDDAHARCAIRALLEEVGGHAVVEAATGSEALRALYSARYDCVVLDLMLGEGLSGWDVLHVKNADPALAAVPLVVVTGLDTWEAHGRPLTCVALMFQKPIVDAAGFVSSIAMLVASR